LQIARQKFLQKENPMATGLKVEKFSGLQRAAPERIEKNEVESALRSAQAAYDYQLLDLRNEFVQRESRLRQEFLDRVAQITTEAGE
jgi:hypothetical protein